MTSKTTVSLALMGLLFAAVAAEADYSVPEIASQEKIELCVAAIADEADYGEANYVRHVVQSKARAAVGYTLNISTLVYDESEGQLIREYHTTCAVSGQPEPVLFKMREAK